MNKAPIDQAQRERAITTFHQNIIVTAGAGTGKTTLLINRLIHLMMRKPDPIKITEIVALTFTNKAANEMKSRLREALERLQDEGATERIAALNERYGLSIGEMTRLATVAIRQLERSEIGTIHHFATTLLRLYPLEAGVDPQFRIDEGGRVSESLFEKTWMAWLEAELSSDAPRKTQWQSILPLVSLSELREVALSLSSENVELETLLGQVGESGLSDALRAWIASLETSAKARLNVHPESRNIEKLLAAALRVFQNLLENDRTGRVLLEDLLIGLNEADQALILSDKKVNKVKGWEEDELKEAIHLIKMARQILHVDPSAILKLLQLLRPFVKRIKKEMHRLGLISFDALLIRARNLLRDHPGVREALKKRYQAILIDEFQDTDPVQYEILLFLSEVDGESAAEWQEVKLSPGKLFVVGDPKQSIYGFRRADIAACQRIRALILQQGGIECLLTTNFRSHSGILDPVNRLFEQLIQAEDGRQPEYIAIHSADEALASEENVFRQFVFRSVKNANENEKTDADLARRLEAEAIALWLSEEVIGKAMIKDKSGQNRPVQKGDVVILMRSLTAVHFYLEALRRRGITYAVEGERRFYQSQEVIDAINLLRVVADPTDRLALVALLRSPVGALQDDEIYQLHRENQLAYLQPENVSLRLDAHLHALYGLLKVLHQDHVHLPVGEAVRHIFEETPIKLLAASSIHGEQALANLEKIQQIAAGLAEEGMATFKDVVDILARSVAEEREETESPLAEEGVDAVKVFSVHKAKGLEFPVVVLAGCHAGTGPQGRDRMGVRQDWSSALLGIFVGDLRDLNSIYLGEKERLRELAEEKRVLYVAMTRAREHLMLSAAATDKLGGGSFLSLFEAGSEGIAGGIPGIDQQSVTATLDELPHPPAQKKTRPLVDWENCANLWQKRRNQYETTLKRPSFVNPTFLKKLEGKTEAGIRFSRGSSSHAAQNGEKALMIGRLAHHFLETWDFSSATENYLETLKTFIKHQLTSLSGFSYSEVCEDLKEIFDVFFHSRAYKEIAQSEIIGREIPFFMPWQGQVMEGVIDVVYEKSGALYIGEYKTDRVNKENFNAAAARYRHQTMVYPEAVKRALQRDVMGVRLIFLRVGESLDLGSSFAP